MHKHALRGLLAYALLGTVASHATPASDRLPPALLPEYAAPVLPEVLSAIATLRQACSAWRDASAAIGAAEPAAAPPPFAPGPEAGICTAVQSPDQVRAEWLIEGEVLGAVIAACGIAVLGVIGFILQFLSQSYRRWRFSRSAGSW